VQQEQEAVATRNGLRWLAKREVIVASHRGPVEYHLGADGSLVAARGSGGVMGALASLGGAVPFTWVSAAMTDGDRLAARSGSPTILPRSHIDARLVSVPESAYDAHYGFFSNRVLWFIQHGLADQIAERFTQDELSRAWAAGYQVVNTAFAAEIAGSVRGPDPVFLLQDYQLYELPGAIRQLAGRGRILHFTHIPWPAPQAWEVLPLPIRRQLLSGMLGADILGFQDPRSAQRFLATCEVNLPMVGVDYENGRVRHAAGETLARTYPISVDPETLSEEMAGETVRGFQDALASKSSEKTIVRVDRVDPAKNIPLGFQAFGNMLQRRPDLVGKVRFLAFMVPSRGSLPEYQAEYGRMVHSVDVVNQRFGSDGYQPIELFYENNWHQALAGMSLADVVLVNSIADGMNLVAKEATIVNRKDAVLVLSTQTGAWAELGGPALGVEPRDLHGTSTALEHAIDMPPSERAIRASALRLRTEAHDVWDWLDEQCEDLASLKVPAESRPLSLLTTA
jgi:trehalose 6-phosphate synthase